MTLRDALLADTERRGVRRANWTGNTRVQVCAHGWSMVEPMSAIAIQVLWGGPTPDDILATDWEVMP